MEKQIDLEEEAGIGIPKERLINAGAKPLNFADYLIFDGKIYEPVRWKKEEKDKGVAMIPTYYRERHMPVLEK